MRGFPLGVRIFLVLVSLFFLPPEYRFYLIPGAGVYLVLQGLLFFFGARYLREAVFFWLGRALDFAFILGLIGLTGGAESPFIFFIFLPSLETAFSGNRLRTDLTSLVALFGLFYFFFRSEHLGLRHWLQFFAYVGALGVTGFLALKLSSLRSELIRQEDIRQNLLDSLSAGLVFLDRNMRILSWNPRAREILPGLEKGVPLSRVVASEIHPNSSRGEMRLGGTILGYSLFPIRRNREILGWGFLFQDITEVREKEEKLQEAQRLASLGSMAAGLIHEIKNPLATISGGIEFLRERLGNPPDLAPILEVISRESERLNRLVTNFLFFARPERGETEIFAPRELMEEILRADPAFFSRIRLEQDLPPGRVRANREQWRQIWENLLRNAVEAALESPSPRVKVKGFFEDHFFVFRVEDSGPGIPEEVRSRLFDPFFTTKARGTGLGLAVVYRIVENLKGELKYFSGPEGGTIFEVRIPGVKVES